MSWLAKMCEAQKYACDAYLEAPNWGLIRKRRIAVIDSTLMSQITDLKISMAEEEVNDVSQVDAFNPFPPSVQRHAVTPV